MTPGRELDALVAERVMGFVNDTDSQTLWNLDKCWKMPNGRYVILPHYSTDIAAAWEVLVKSRKDIDDGSFEECLVFFSSNPAQMPHWKCEIRNSLNTFRAIADTAPHAICLAALKAVSGEK